MSHVINMTFFNQVQSIQILYLCKSITEAAWKYSCKSPDSSQALFSFFSSHSGSSPSCLINPSRPSNMEICTCVPVTICRPSILLISVQFEAMDATAPTMRAKKLSLHLTWVLPGAWITKGKKSCDLFSILLYFSYQAKRSPDRLSAL